MSRLRRLPIQRLRRTLGAASCVRERGRFVVSEFRKARSVRQYRLRGSDLVAHVRHPLMDMWGVEEMFRFGTYEPPDEVIAVLRGLDHAPRILDLGGHVGFFGLFMRSRFPDAEVVSFEPDPENGRLLARSIEANGLADRWRLMPACAATRDGTVEFASSGHLSRAHPDADASFEQMQRRISRVFPFLEDTPLLNPERLTVESRDVFPFLEEADLIKIDIEGSEWPLIEDSRFERLGAAAIVFEYHPTYGPGDSAEDVLRERLRTAGFTPGASERGGDAGMMWAWRADVPAAAAGSTP